LTLLGPGGTGKTRLAIQAGAEQFETFPDGVFFVPLASVQSDESAISAVADAIGFTFYSNEDPKTQLINYLEGKTLLVVMDNCEHLDGVNTLISELLGAAPELTVLATSRARLNLKGEVVLDLEGLEVPESPSVNDVDDYSGLRLFVDSAQRAQADFTVDEDNLSHIVRVCRLLNGMPLGIELAAAWVRMLPVEEIIEEIETSLDFLESAYEDLPERQRSLRAVFDYSWQLLSEEEQTAFAKLSVFRGEFDRRAAKQVADVSMMALASLVDKSLLHADDEGRYSIHNLLRQYAEEQLAQTPERHRQALDNHGEHLADWMAGYESALVGERQVDAFQAIQQAFDDVRYMWQTALDQGEWSRIDRSLHCLFHFCDRRSRFQEGETLFKTALEAVPDVEPGGPSVKHRLQARLASFRSKLGQTESAERLLHDALAVARERDDSAETAFALIGLSSMLLNSDPSRARAFAEESLGIYRELSDKEGMAQSFNILGTAEYHDGNWELSRDLREQSLALYREVGDKQFSARMMVNIGGLERQQKNLEQARELYEQSLTMVRELDDKESIAKIQMNLGILQWQLGHPDDGQELLQRSLAIERELGHKEDIAMNLGNMSVMELKKGNMDKSRELIEESLAIARQIGDKRRIALYMHNLGNLALEQEDIGEARSQFEGSLAISHDQGRKQITIENLSGLASVLHAEGQHSLSAQLQGAITAFLADIGTMLDSDERASYDQTAASLQEELGNDGYEQAFGAGQAWSLEEAIEHAMPEDPSVHRSH
ncbi:MAG: tetratricopeptide repeat protein, partial [Candidatus Bipolaricaulia bacterium]